MSDIKKVCVIGAGYLGTQIGLTCARNGYDVHLYDISREALDISEGKIGEYLEEWVKADDITTESSQRIRDRIYFADNLEETAKANIVIEAVVEDLEVKRSVFKELETIFSPETIIATNSSSIRVSKIEKGMDHPERVLNMHFYSYPWRTRIVEIMKGKHTADGVVKKAVEFSRSINVTPLMVQKESTGFIFNRIWRAIKKETLTVVDDKIASHEDVDRAWMSLYGTTAGPFGMMDRVGLDVVRDIELVYYNESGDPKDLPPKILLEKINKGELGVKTGKGFYDYPDPSYSDPDWLHG
ncbi:3-hydroxyacyl-CoA dehydrogenase family protein [Candidatus Bathyarchaeota archaeon]|nr:3-hydroxyacyl-CoA dehydrogenase family protein [Candidatus Bathyarchaeota archaeon]